MQIHLIACGVFQPELDQIFPDLAATEFPEHRILVHYLEMALHNHVTKLTQELKKALSLYQQDGLCIVLFGSKCSPEILDICRAHNVYLPPQNNCIDLYVSKQEQTELANGDEVFFLTHGWFINWKNSLVEDGWDTYDARMNFGRYDSFLLLDPNQRDYTDEELIDFFEYTTVPIEIKEISLQHFTSVLRSAIQASLQTAKVYACKK